MKGWCNSWHFCKMFFYDHVFLLSGMWIWPCGLHKAGETDVLWTKQIQWVSFNFRYPPYHLVLSFLSRDPTSFKKAWGQESSIYFGHPSVYRTQRGWIDEDWSAFLRFVNLAPRQVSKSATWYPSLRASLRTKHNKHNTSTSSVELEVRNHSSEAP